jgi:hypothetical protein
MRNSKFEIRNSKDLARSARCFYEFQPSNLAYSIRDLTFSNFEFRISDFLHEIY